MIITNAKDMQKHRVCRVWITQVHNTVVILHSSPLTKALLCCMRKAECELCYCGYVMRWINRSMIMLESLYC